MFKIFITITLKSTVKIYITMLLKPVVVFSLPQMKMSVFSLYQNVQIVAIKIKLNIEIETIVVRSSTLLKNLLIQTTKLITALD